MLYRLAENCASRNMFDVPSKDEINKDKVRSVADLVLQYILQNGAISF
jgi:hypothetical protein